VCPSHLREKQNEPSSARQSKGVRRVACVRDVSRVVAWADDHEFVVRNFPVQPVRVLVKEPCLGFGRVADHEIHHLARHHLQRQSAARCMYPNINARLSAKGRKQYIQQSRVLHAGGGCDVEWLSVDGRAARAKRCKKTHDQRTGA